MTPSALLILPDSLVDDVLDDDTPNALSVALLAAFDPAVARAFVAALRVAPISRANALFAAVGSVPGVELAEDSEWSV